MFTRLFGKPKQEVSTVSTLDKLSETLELLEKKENVLSKKAAEEVEKAKAFTRAKNKRVEEAYMKVLGTSSGYIKGLGFGPKPPKRIKDGSHEEYASFSRQMVDQFDNLERSSRERENKLNEQIQELKKDKAIMLEEMENMKKSAAEREERMRSEIFEMG